MPAANAVVAIDDNLGFRISFEFPPSLRQFVHRDQHAVRQRRDRMLLRLADVDQSHRFAARQFSSKILYRYFVDHHYSVSRPVATADIAR